MKTTSKWIAILAGMLMLACLPASPAAAAGRVPEKLIYSLSWSGIPVGTATQEIFDEGPLRRIVSTARSNAWLSAFYTVDDRTESMLVNEGAFPGTSRHFRMKIHEGKTVRDREISFFPAAGKAIYHDLRGGERKEIAITENTFDIYSSFYYVRFLDLKPGRPVYLHVLDGKELQRIEVRVLRRERISTPVGEFDTIAIEPMVKPEGVFEGKKGAIIWLTDDARRIPVKAQTKVKVGSVTAVLTGGEY